MSYLLDSDTVSYALREEGGVASRIRAARSDLAVSAISVAEMEYGIEKKKSARLRRSMDDFMTGMRILMFDAAAARAYGRLLAWLQARGRPIGELDTLIAAHAIATGRTLVSNNTREFSRVPGLRLETWY